MIEFEDLADGLNHPEGVAWDPFSGCVWAGGEGGELYRLTLDGAVDQWAVGGSMLGVAVDGAGRVLACDDGTGRVVRLDPGSLSFDRIAEDLDTPNMLAFAPDGALFVTCSGEDGDPCIVRVLPDGKVERWSEEVPGYPNGCLVTPDGRELVVVEAHAQRLVGVAIEPGGAAGAVRTIATLPGTDPDGVALAADGSLIVTLYRPDGLVRVRPDGAVEPILEDPLAHTFDAPTNLCFVGPTLERAVVANVGDRFLSIGSVGVGGAPLHYPRSP